MSQQDILRKEVFEQFRQYFEQLAVNGFIGDPYGELGYGYLRVSTEEQAKEGRYGIQRQIRNLDEAARRDRVKISWDMIFMDFDTGFEFRHRTGLTKFRRESGTANKRAKKIVFEDIDRLSRNSEWHQGFLLEEMQIHSITPIFWKALSGRIERAVYGAISQEGMETAKARMREAQREKARAGRVTARQAAYGFRLVDSFGNEGRKASNDTHYAKNDTEAPVVIYIYVQLGEKGIKLRALAKLLDALYSPPKNSKSWSSTLIRTIVRNPVYKGEFIANRWLTKKGLRPRKDGSIRLVEISRTERPREEWIIVDVPAIVSPKLWEAANRALDQNKKMSSRNGDDKFLLTGLIKCSTCGYSYTGHTVKEKRGSKIYIYTIYRCSHRATALPKQLERINCRQPQIVGHVLENAVWSAVCHSLLQPEILIDVLERQYHDEFSEELKNEIHFLEQEIKANAKEDNRLYQAYRAGAFDPPEYAEKRKHLKQQAEGYHQELDKLKQQIMTESEFEERKAAIMQMSQTAKGKGLALDAPYEIKKTVLATIVDTIELNVSEGWFKLVGVISGTYYLDPSRPPDDSGGATNDEIVFIPARVASWQAIAQSPNRMKRPDPRAMASPTRCTIRTPISACRIASTRSQISTG